MSLLIGTVTLHDERHNGVDRYSDGEVEDELLALVRSTDRPEEALAGETRWPLLYHLSPLRRNLLEWYGFPPGTSLLEVGAGCGALTGLFCERADRVVAVELSRRRAEILATRHRRCANLAVHAGSLDDVELTPERFGVVTLIGVLEYAPRFVDGPDPATRLLTRVARLLQPGGVLLLAIENRFGLKYWAGAREDHTGGLFDSIQGYPGNPGVLTFGREELAARLTAAGFVRQAFYYPMPDYKLPTEVFSDERLPLPGELSRPLPNRDRDRLRLFDEGPVYDGLVRNGVFPFFASSFLVEARRGDL